MCRLGRLGRLAADVEALSSEIASAPLTVRDEVLLAPTLLHFAIALERIEQAIYDANRLDLRNQQTEVRKAA